VTGDAPRLLTVGRIGPARGIRGEVFVEPWTDDPQIRFESGAVLATDPAGLGPLTVNSSSSGSGKLVVHFVGVDTRDDAEALRGALLLVRAAGRPALDDPDDFYVDELVGLQVRTVTGHDLGGVLDVIDIGGAQYLVVAVDGQQRLIPFVAAIVPQVDIEAKIVTVDPPDGLLEL
jgi:16S rRNA processing protein RimM